MARRVVPFTLALVALVATAGCSVNPATGQRQLTLISEQQEIAMGRENDRQIVASMGLYPDEELQSYVQELGSRMAAQSERPNLPWTFRVVDDPIVNAFALPGGFIYITRGILSHFNSEAELVSVLGHEIGHVTGRHGVERLSKAQLANLGVGVAAVASRDFRNYGGLVMPALQLAFLKFSRDDEREADGLGLRYLVRSDYDPREMPKVFETLGRVSQAAGGGRIPNWMATHPAPENRVRNISAAISQLSPDQVDGQIARDAYLDRLAGLTFGENPRDGFFQGNVFYHPEMAFTLTFPQGWKMVNTRQAVGAISPQQDALVVLTLASEQNPDAAARSFFSQNGVEQGRAWRRNFYNFRTVPPQTQQPQQQGQQAPPTLRGLAGFFEHGGRTFQILSYSRQEQWRSYRPPAQQSLASFGRLTDRRYLEVQPRRVRIVQLDRDMSLAEFHRRYPSTIELGELAIVNGVEETEVLRRGTRVKRVVGGELP